MRIPPYKQTFKTKADQRASGALFNNCTIEIERISRNDFHLIEVSYIQRTLLCGINTSQSTSGESASVRPT